MTAADSSGELPAAEKLAAQHTAELRETRRRIFDAGDTARRQLGRDLHDGAQQQLITAVIDLQRAQRLWSTDPDRAKELLDGGLERAESGLQALRALAWGIHPPILTHRGLGAAVESLAGRMPMPVTLELTTERLPASLEASVYFFVSETLSNVVKHAKASNVAVRIVVEDGRLVVDASDDGVGGAAATAEGSGLWGLADRVEALGGDFDLTSSAQAGTSVHADIPMPVPPRPL
jgi:signal transduction histidine kinase